MPCACRAAREDSAILKLAILLFVVAAPLQLQIPRVLRTRGRKNCSGIRMKDHHTGSSINLFAKAVGHYRAWLSWVTVSFLAV